MKEKMHNSLFEWVDNWLEVYAKPMVKERTYITYSYSAGHLKRYLGNDIAINEFNDYGLQQILNAMASDNYAKSTINKVKVLVKSVYDAAIRNNFASINPADYVRLPIASSKRVVSLTASEQEVVEEACEHVLLGDIALFFLETGLRADELINLRNKDYFKNKREIFVRKSKTNAGVRVVPLTDKAIEIIERQEKINEYIFNSSRKKPLTTTVLKRLYERLRKKTGITKITNHVYRHSFATRALENGMDYKALSEILGHVDVAFTLRTYTHVDTKFLHEQMKKMNK